MCFISARLQEIVPAAISNILRCKKVMGLKEPQAIKTRGVRDGSFMCVRSRWVGNWYVSMSRMPWGAEAADTSPLSV